VDLIINEGFSKLNYQVFRSSALRDDADANEVTHFFSSHFSVPCAYLCYRLGLSPNKVTAMFLVFGILSGMALYFQAAIIAYILWRIHIIMDMADGNLARATKKFSSSATGFDRSNHIAINTTVLLGPITATGNVLLANVLVVTFFLNYLFYRNYIKEKVQTKSLSISASILRHALGIEGYILVMTGLLLFNMDKYVAFAALIYAFLFISLFLIKLYRHNRS